MQTLTFANAAAISEATRGLTRDEQLTCAVSADGDGYSLTGPDAVVAKLGQPPAIDVLIAYAAARRYACEVAGKSVNGVVVATDRESQAMIANTDAYLQRSGVAAVPFKAASGWIELSAEQVRVVALAVGAHVQACFAAENAADAGINATPSTVRTFADVDAIFAPLVA